MTQPKQKFDHQGDEELGAAKPQPNGTISRKAAKGAQERNIRKSLFAYLGVLAR